MTNFVSGVLASTTSLKTIVTAELLGGLLDEIVGLLPVIIPVMIGFIGLRKAIAFLFSTMRSA